MSVSPVAALHQGHGKSAGKDPSVFVEGRWPLATPPINATDSRTVSRIMPIAIRGVYLSQVSFSRLLTLSAGGGVERRGSYRTSELRQVNLMGPDCSIHGSLDTEHQRHGRVVNNPAVELVLI